MKKNFKFIVVIILTGVILWFGQNKVNESESLPESRLPQNSEESVKNEVSFSIFFEEGNSRVFDSIPLDNGASVFDVLRKISEENNMPLEYKDYGESMGVMIQSIDGLENNFEKEKKYWQYWVNEEYSKEGASSYILENNDSVEWRYTQGQF